MAKPLDPERRHRGDRADPRHRHQAARLVVLPGSRPDFLLKAIDLLAKTGDLLQQKACHLADRFRQIQVRISKRRRQTLDMNRALGSNDTELRQMAAKRVDRLGPLAHQKIACAEKHAPSLLLGGTNMPCRNWIRQVSRIPEAPARMN